MRLARVRRRVTSAVMTTAVAGLAGATVLALLLILGNLVAQGATSLDWNFFTRNPVSPGQAGGGVIRAGRLPILGAYPALAGE